MKIELKNSNDQADSINPLINYFQKLGQKPLWNYMGMFVELDPTIDCKKNDALIRWTDIDEGFNDKIIVNSLQEFKSTFKLIHA